MADTPAAPKTIGMELDAKVAVLEARIAVLEAEGKLVWSDVVAWFKSNWLHLVNAGGIAATLGKLFGVLHL